METQTTEMPKASKRRVERTEFTHCGYCGKQKRGWRRLYAEQVCSDCERRGVAA